jgi:hypothetical protein
VDFISGILKLIVFHYRELCICGIFILKEIYDGNDIQKIMILAEHNLDKDTYNYRMVFVTAND